jgi:hypothetical protein
MVGLAATSSGSAVIVSEYTTGMRPMTSWVTLALDPATGAILWERLKAFDTTATFESALALSPDGSTAYVTGYSDVWLTIGYNTANGAKAFRAGYDQRARNYAYAIAVSPDGSQVVVTGTSNQGPTSDDVMTTAAYSTG